MASNKNLMKRQFLLNIHIFDPTSHHARLPYKLMKASNVELRTLMTHAFQNIIRT